MKGRKHTETMSRHFFNRCGDCSEFCHGMPKDRVSPFWDNDVTGYSYSGNRSVIWYHVYVYGAICFDLDRTYTYIKSI